MPPDDKWGNSHCSHQKQKHSLYSDTLFPSKYGDAASFDWLQFLWCSKETCLAEGDPIDETEGKIPRGLNGSGETQKSNKGNRFRLLILKCYRRLSCLLEWKFTKDRSRLCFQQFNLLHLLATGLLQPTVRKEPIAPLSSQVN